jgi:hypothetical protein
MAVLVRMTRRFFARKKEPYSAMEFCAFGL